MSSWIIIINIYTTFCQTFKQRGPLNLTFLNFLILIIISIILVHWPINPISFHLVLSIHMFLIFLLFFICRKIHVRPSDTIAIVFCGSQKSLTSGTFVHENLIRYFLEFINLGMPILQMIFPDNISITIPLLIYHPMQIILGNYLTPKFQRWLTDAKYEWLVL